MKCNKIIAMTTDDEEETIDIGVQDEVQRVLKVG
jgi:hypothetical protein